MIIERSNYEDVESPPAHCDVWMVKRDGNYAFCKTGSYRMNHWSRTGRLVRSVHAPIGDCLLLGEYMFGRERAMKSDLRYGSMVFFDCLEALGKNIRSMPYAFRLAVARKMVESDEWFSVIEPHLLTDESLRADVWNNQVMTGELEGLIYRDSGEAFPGTAYRHKGKFKAILTAVEFTESESDTYFGQVRSIEGMDDNGVITLVSGITAAMRRELTDNRESYLGRDFEVTHHGVFDSGKLQDARFKRWLPEAL